MTDHETKPRRLTVIIIFLHLALIIPTAAVASGQSDDNLAAVDRLIEAKQYSTAILAIEELIVAQPELFEEAQRRIDRIIRYRDEYNQAVQLLLDDLLDESTDYTRKLDIIAQLNDLDPNPNPAIKVFLQRTEENALFAKNRASLYSLMDQANSFWQAGNIFAAVENYRAGFSLYYDQFTASLYGDELVAGVNQRLLELSDSLDRFEIVEPRLTSLKAEIGSRLVTAWQAEDQASLLSLIWESDQLLKEIITIQNLALGAGELMHRQFEYLTTTDTDIGDNHFLPFAKRLILGRDTASQPEGLYALIESQFEAAREALISLADWQALQASQAAFKQPIDTGDSAIQAFSLGREAGLIAQYISSTWAASNELAIQPYAALVQAMSYGLSLEKLNSVLTAYKRELEQLVAGYQPDSDHLSGLLKSLTEAAGRFVEFKNQFTQITSEIEILEIAQPLEAIKQRSIDLGHRAAEAENLVKAISLEYQIRDLDQRITDLIKNFDKDQIMAVLEAYEDGLTVEVATDRLALAADYYQTTAQAAVKMMEEISSYTELWKFYQTLSLQGAELAAVLPRLASACQNLIDQASQLERLTGLAVLQLDIGELAKAVSQFRSTVRLDPVLELEYGYRPGVNLEKSVAQLVDLSQNYHRFVNEAAVWQQLVEDRWQDLASFEIDSAKQARLQSALEAITDSINQTVTTALTYAKLAETTVIQLQLADWSRRIGLLDSQLPKTGLVTIELGYYEKQLEADVVFQQLADYQSQVLSFRGLAATLEQESTGFLTQIQSLNLAASETQQLIDRLDSAAQAAANIGQEAKNLASQAALASFAVELAEWEKQIQSLEKSAPPPVLIQLAAAFSSGELSSDQILSQLADYRQKEQRIRTTALALEHQAEDFIGRLADFQPLRPDGPVSAAKFNLMRDHLALVRQTAEQAQSTAVYLAIEISLSGWETDINHYQNQLALIQLETLISAYQAGELAIPAVLERLQAIVTETQLITTGALSLADEATGFTTMIEETVLAHQDRVALMEKIEDQSALAKATAASAEVVGRQAITADFGIRLSDWQTSSTAMAAAISDMPISQTAASHAAGQLTSQQAVAVYRSIDVQYAAEAAKAKEIRTALAALREQLVVSGLDSRASIELETGFITLDKSLAGFLEILDGYRLRCLVAIIGLPLTEVTVQLNRLKADYQTARQLMDGQIQPDGVIGAKNPQGAVEVLATIEEQAAAVAKQLVTWQQDFDSDYVDSKSIAVVAELISEKALLASDLSWLSQTATAALTEARERLAQAEMAIVEADFRYNEAVAALAADNFSVARDRLQRSSERYDFALALQDSPRLRLQRDERLLSLATAISRAENVVVVREVRQLITEARNYYFSADYLMAENALLTAQDRWRTTNVADDDEVTYWLALVRAALLLQAGRDILVTAPLYSEMRQLLSSAYQIYNIGQSLLDQNRSEEALLALETAIQKIREVKILFPLNREAGLLQLKIEQLADPASFDSSFRRRVSEASQNLLIKPQESYAELQDLSEINPNFPGLAAIIEDAQIMLGLKLPLADAADLKRAAELTAEAKRIIDIGQADHYEAALQNLNQALILHPDNTETIALKDRLQTRIGGQAMAVLSATSEQDYQRAVRELQKGNTIFALAIVERLLQEPLNQNSQRILELERRIRVRL